GLCLCAATLCASPAAMAAYPDHPVRFVVGFPPGGGVDITSRLMAQKLSEKWGQAVIVENKPGADGTLAGDIVAHSPPHGYTLQMASISHALTPGQYKLNYDAVKSFAPITLVAKSPLFILVRPSLGVNSLKELIALAKEKPGKLNYGTSGPYSSSGLASIL